MHGHRQTMCKPQSIKGEPPNHHQLTGAGETVHMGWTKRGAYNQTHAPNSNTFILLSLSLHVVCFWMVSDAQVAPVFDAKGIETIRTGAWMEVDSLVVLKMDDSKTTTTPSWALFFAVVVVVVVVVQCFKYVYNAFHFWLALTVTVILSRSSGQNVLAPRVFVCGYVGRDFTQGRPKSIQILVNKPVPPKFQKSSC